MSTQIHQDLLPNLSTAISRTYNINLLFLAAKPSHSKKPKMLFLCENRETPKKGNRLNPPACPAAAAAMSGTCPRGGWPRAGPLGPTTCVDSQDVQVHTILGNLYINSYSKCT